jgi:hypothetical protein
MHIFTINYLFEEMVDDKNEKEATFELLSNGIKESFEPSKKSINNIMSFAKAYCYSDSDNMSSIEY